MSSMQAMRQQKAWLSTDLRAADFLTGLSSRKRKITVTFSTAANLTRQSSEWKSSSNTFQRASAPPQVWSLTQFYFSESRIDVKKCVFNKRTIKVVLVALTDKFNALFRHGNFPVG